MLLKDLEKEWIDSSHVEVVKGEHMMFTWIQVNKNGGRSITMFPNVLIKLTAEDVESKHREDIASSRVLHAEARLATEREMKRALELSDVLIPCKNAAKELIDSDDFIKDGRKLLEYGSRAAAITLGEKGCIVLDGTSMYTVPAYRIKVVDTTGEGDAFHGGFIYNVLNLRGKSRLSGWCIFGRSLDHPFTLRETWIGSFKL